jgi:hypothetical protein
MPYDRTAYFEQRNQRRLQNAGSGISAPEAQVESAQIHADAVTEAAARANGDIRGSGTLTKYRPSTGGWQDPSGAPQVEAATISAGAHQYTADKALEGVKYAADRKDPFVDPHSGETLDGYADGGFVPAGKKVVVGDGGGPEIFQATAPGVIKPGLQNAEPVRRSAWLQKQREAAALERTKVAHAGPNKLIDFQIQEKMREHNLAAFNTKVDAMYPGAVNEKTGKPGVSPAAEEFKDRYKAMAEMDPDNALKAVGGAMKLTGLVDKYRSGPNPGPGLADANAARQAGKIDEGYYKRLVAGEPHAVLDFEANFQKNSDASNLHPGLLTGQPTPSGMPGLTAPGNPDSTPGIHSTPAGDRIRVSINPDGTRTEQLIGRAPSQGQLDKWQDEYAQTPEGKLPQGYFVGGDGQVYKTNRDTSALPTLAGVTVPGAPAAPVAAAPAAPTGGAGEVLAPAAVPVAPKMINQAGEAHLDAVPEDPALRNWQAAGRAVESGGRTLVNAMIPFAQGAETALYPIRRGLEGVGSLAVQGAREVIPGTYKAFDEPTPANPLGLQNVTPAPPPERKLEDIRPSAM